MYQPLQGEWEQRVSSEKQEIDAKEEVKAQRGMDSSSEGQKHRATRQIFGVTTADTATTEPCLESPGVLVTSGQAHFSTIPP